MSWREWAATMIISLMVASVVTALVLVLGSGHDSAKPCQTTCVPFDYAMIHGKCYCGRTDGSYAPMLEVP